MSARIVDRDNGYAKFMAAMKDAARGKGLSVGIHAKEGAEIQPSKDPKAKPVTLVEIGAFNEFGLGVPERSFIRGWYDENRPEIRAAIETAVKNSITGKMTLAEGLTLCGLKFVGQIQQRMAAGISPPNAPATIKKKGSSKPLIDTGALRQSITFQVHDGTKPPP